MAHAVNKPNLPGKKRGRKTKPFVDPPAFNCDAAEGEYIQEVDTQKGEIKLYTPYDSEDHRNITALCKERYKSLKAIIDHINKAIDDCFKSDYNEIMENVVVNISSIFPNNTITIYGPYSWNLVDKSTDLLYISLNTAKGFNKVLEILKKLPNMFLILEEKSFAHTKNFIIYKDQATQMKCAIIPSPGQSSPDISLSTKIFLFYLILDTRVEWLLVAVRTWWSMNFVNWQDTIVRGEFILEWMVLFFLMSPNITIIPPISSLISNPTAKMSEWEDFMIDEEQVRAEHNTLKKCKMDQVQLLIHFFYFYENIDFDVNNVLCLFSGKILGYNEFFDNYAKYYSNEITLPNQLSLMNPVNNNHDMFQRVGKIKFGILKNKFYSTLSHIVHS